MPHGDLIRRYVQVGDVGSVVWNGAIEKARHDAETRAAVDPEVVDLSDIILHIVRSRTVRRGRSLKTGLTSAQILTAAEAKGHPLPVCQRVLKLLVKRGELKGKRPGKGIAVQYFLGKDHQP